MFRRAAVVFTTLCAALAAAGMPPWRPLIVAAQQSSANMMVMATVIPKCVVTTVSLNFGVYDLMLMNSTVPLDAQSTITVACTRGTAVSIGIDNGAYNRGTVRRMYDNRGNYLEYELYKDQSRTQRWGDTLGGRYDGGVAPSRDPRQFIVYGRVPPAQDVDQGGYMDSVVVTVHF